MAGKRPRSSHAAKKNVQSMYGVSSSSAGSTRRRPVNEGTGRSAASQSVRNGLARASAYVASFRSPRRENCSRSRAWSARFPASNAARRSGFSRPETTSTTREASATWTVLPSNAGAIRTAVCWRDVVAPPMSSGVRIFRRRISPATNTISSSDGVIRPLSPIRSAPSSAAARRIRSQGTITPRSITS